MTKVVLLMPNCLIHFIKENERQTFDYKEMRKFAWCHNVLHPPFSVNPFPGQLLPADPWQHISYQSSWTDHHFCKTERCCFKCLRRSLEMKLRLSWYI